MQQDGHLGNHPFKFHVFVWDKVNHPPSTAHRAPTAERQGLRFLERCLVAVQGCVNSTAKVIRRLGQWVASSINTKS